MLKNIPIWKNNIFLIVMLFVLIGSLQVFLFNLLLNYGFTPDDWRLVAFYKTLGNNPFSQILFVWSMKGAHTTSQIYFIGVLNIFFGLNYSAFYIVNIIIKIFAAVSIYPLILIIFKRRFLAFVASVVYGMSYVGSLSVEYVVKGTDYLAIIPMNAFFIFYYLSVIGKTNRFRFLLMAFFWFLSLFISPIRIYPLLVLIPIIECCLFIQNRSTKKISNSFRRLLILYLPLLMVYLYKQDAVNVFLQSPHMIFQAVFRGNLHLILTPFQGLGITWFSLQEWNSVFNNIDMSSFKQYIFSLYSPAKGPFFIFSLLTIFISLFIFKRKIRAFILIFVSNLIISTFFFYIIKYGLGIPEIFRYQFDFNKIYPILISGFLFSVVLASFLEWRFYRKKNELLFALWITPLLAFIYIFLIWLLAPFGVGFENRQGYYLVIPAIGASIFLSAFLNAIYDKIAYRKNRFIRIILYALIILILISLFLLNRENIDNYYNHRRDDGRFAQDQEILYERLFDKIKNISYKGNSFFYFGNIEDNLHSNYFYEQALIESLPSKILIRNKKTEEICITVFSQEVEKLNKIAISDKGVKGFIYSGQCNQKAEMGKKFFYSIDNFYAFSIRNGEIVDIKQEILSKLTF